MSDKPMVVVAGATGALGGAVIREVAARGWAVRALVRDAGRLAPEVRGLVADVHIADGRDPATLAGACRGADVVFSCAGASVLPTLGRGWRGFGAVDTRVNRNLISAAQADGAPAFVYVSVFHHPDMRRLAYVDAHERVVDQLRASPLSWAVVRPTGFHSAIASFVDLARKGKIPEIGDGTARTNPIADADLAAVCADAITDAGHRTPAVREVSVGGPEVLTRREMAELAFRALGREPRVRHIPPGVARFGATMLRAVHPRIGQFMKFIADIGTRDLIAPSVGQRRLAEAYAAAAVPVARAA